MHIRILLSLALAVLAAGLAPAAFAQQLFYIHADHLNTPRLVTDGNGTPVWRWDQTEPFGDNLPNEDPDGNSIPGHMPLRFPGQYFDKEINLHYNYFRDYDSGIGRYVQSDPIGLGGGINTYLYALAKPLKYVDPDGTSIGSPAIPLPRQLPLTRPIPGPVDPVVPAPGNKKDDGADHCTRLYVRCIQERWGGDWSCGDCHFYCTGINQAWPFEHCSPSLPEMAGCRAAPKGT